MEVAWIRHTSLAKDAYRIDKSETMNVIVFRKVLPKTYGKCTTTKLQKNEDKLLVLCVKRILRWNLFSIFFSRS